MIAKVGTPCVFCGNPMHINSCPNWIFDLEKAVLRGLAHRTCTFNAKLGWWASKSTKWGSQSPSQSQIDFGCKLAKIMEELKAYGGRSDEFYCKMLLYKCIWKTASLEECLENPSVNEFLDWWLNGSKIITLEKHSRIKQLFTEKIKEALS